MPDAKYFTKEGSESKTVALGGPLFESETKQHVLHEYVIGYLRNRRQGTSSTLNRSRMKGGGKKPYRQKGTGRARAGTNISPVWVGGAIAFGPRPRSFFKSMPSKLKRSAFYSAFSLRAKEGNIKIVEIPEISEAKTKLVADYLKKLGVYQEKTLLLYEGMNENLSRASRNIKYFNAKRAELTNPYDLIWHRNILITEEGLARLKEIFNDA